MVISKGEKIALIVVLLLCLAFLANIGHTSWRKFGDTAIPNFYMFLLFPKNHVNIYKSASGDSEGIIGRLDSAVTASKKEILSGEIRIVINEKDDGYIKLSDLNYIPISGEDEMLEKWQRRLFLQGYTQGKWKSEKIDSNTWQITLLLVDSQHVRSDQYVFVTDGVNVLRVKDINSRSGIFEGVVALFGLFLVVVYVVVRWIFSKIGARVGSDER